jgi:hypothetical protein
MNRAASAAVNGNANVQKGSGTIWTFADELARLSNVQIVPDPFWTLARDCQPECLARK